MTNANDEEEVACRLAESSPQYSTADGISRNRHLQMLVICSTALILAFMLDVLPSGQVAFHGLHRFPLPESCGSKAIFGISCPGCGLTRSVSRCAHGDFAGSASYHRLGWLMFAAIVAQIPYRILALVYPNRRILPELVCRLFAYGLIAALFVNWFVLLATTGG